MEDPMQAFKQGLASLYKHEQFADFTIICGPHTFKVHKTIICAHSKYFAIACSSGSFKEGKRGELVLKAIRSEDDEDDTCDDPEAVKHMVHFFYCMDYDAASDAAIGANVAHPPDQVLSTPPRQLVTAYASSKYSGRKSKSSKETEKAVSEDAGNMVMHAKIFAAAVKYQVPALQALAASKFIEAVKTNWDQDSFAEAAYVVYTTTPKEVGVLRDEIAKTIFVHGILLQKAVVEAVVRAIDGLAF
ncbi:hypothetical protein LTS02_014387 [Friedmanniomyces endolithicus]|nr:hypothetical protein LTS02_014387 [Friedmanniomyces endolithicus]